MHLGALAAAAISPAVAGAATSEYKLVRTPSPPCPGRALRPSWHDGAGIARATMCLLNVQRRRHRLTPLRPNRALAAIAAGQSEDMVRGNYFDDHSLAGQTPFERIVPALFPARVQTTAQNIGWGTGADATPEGMVRAWMRSPPHRRIILTASFCEAGVGVTPLLPAVVEHGSDGATYSLDLTAFAPGDPAAGACAPTRRAGGPSGTGQPAGESMSTTTRTAQEVESG
jgi:uncharacterized protein YkwD